MICKESLFVIECTRVCLHYGAQLKVVSLRAWFCLSHLLYRIHLTTAHNKPSATSPAGMYSVYEIL